MSDKTVRYVAIIEERYSPGKNVVGFKTLAEATAWRDKIKARVGVLGRTWEWSILWVGDPDEWEGKSVLGDWMHRKEQTS